MSEESVDSVIKRLGEAMSDISEDCYCAGWMGGTEYFVPELCRRALASNENQPWGHGEVTPEHAKKLFDLANALGHWVDLDELGAGYEKFNPFPVPDEYCKALDNELLYRQNKR